jgi:Rad51 protein
MQSLHYLYEIERGDRERFVYLCSSCSCILRVGKELRPVGELVDTLRGTCPGCGRSLEGATECRLIPTPDDWTSIDLAPSKTTEAKQPVFKPASSFVHFSLGFAPLDSVLRPLAPGRLVTLMGPGSSAVSELAAFRAQLPLERGGLDSTVLFIDGGNKSDPYLFASFAKQHGVSPNEALRRVANCRVFTMYQLAQLVSEHLVPAVEDYAAQLVVISDLLGTFNEPELDEREVRRLLSGVERGIAEVKKKALVITTLASPNKYDEQVAAWADTLVRLSSDGDRARVELLKHRSREPVATGFRMRGLLGPEGIC